MPLLGFQWRDPRENLRLRLRYKIVVEAVGNVETVFIPI